MKRTIYFLLLVIAITIQTVEATSLTQQKEWKAAQQFMEEENYTEAIKYYRLLNEWEDRCEKEINSTAIEKLHMKYSVDTLVLEDQKEELKLTRAFTLYLLIILLLALAFFLYLRWKKRRIERYNNQLKQAIEHGKRAIYNTNLILANMSHEIKTPLNALIGFSELLAMEEIDKNSYKQCNDMIHQNATLLLKLINDVVELSNQDIRKIDLKVESCELILLCERVIKTVNQVKTTTVPIKLTSELPQLILRTDVMRLQQVLINLLMNANKFTTAGEIILKIEKQNEQWLQFSVTDTGCGISPKEQTRIFERFEKLDEEVQGSGLGLSICKLIVTHLGGTIWLDTTYKQGARFIFTHPL